MRRWVLLIVAVAVIASLSPFIYELFLSDEEHIRRLMVEMEDSFNEARAGRLVEPLEDGYRDLNYGFNALEIRAIMGRIFLGHRDQESKEFRFRAELQTESLHIEVATDEVATDLEGNGDPKATARGPVLFYERSSPGEVIWGIQVEAELIRGDAGWKIVTTRMTEERGRSPF